MAIKAGRVGVDPSQVTLSGYIKGGGVSPEVLTKEEARRIYQTILGMSEYLKSVDASMLYQRITDMVNYQAKLVSGQNIKRINGEDLLGSGNITVLTRSLADGIYQTISGMSDYALKSEIPDLDDVVTKAEAPGYDDILTKTQARSLYAFTEGEGIDITGNVISNVFEKKTNIDLDTINYNFRGAVENATHQPSGESPNGVLDSIFSTASGVLSNGAQIYRAYNNSSVYVRYFNVTTQVWSSWTKLATTSEVLNLDSRLTGQINSLGTEIATYKCLVISSSSFSSLPISITNSKVTSEHVVVNSILSNPSAQTDDWTVTTSNGSLSISGSINGSTTITLYLMRGE